MWVELLGHKYGQSLNGAQVTPSYENFILAVAMNYSYSVLPRPKPVPAPRAKPSIAPWLNHQDKIYKEKSIETEEIDENDEEHGLVQHMLDEYESIVEEDSDIAAVVRRTEAVLQSRLGPDYVHRAGKRGRSQPSTPKQIKRPRRRGGKAEARRAQTRCARTDDKQTTTQINVAELRYSQASCKELFQCGRSVTQLVKALWDGDVSLSAPFLRLTVFEAIDETTNEYILRCIDNRRLYALKEYALLMDEPVMVNVDFFSLTTVKQVQRYMNNSDDTDGRTVYLRKSNKNIGK